MIEVFKIRRWIEFCGGGGVGDKGSREELIKKKLMVDMKKMYVAVFGRTNYVSISKDVSILKRDIFFIKNIV